MEVQFDFAIDDATQALDQARRLVVGFPLPLDCFEWRAGFDGERALMDDLIAGIKFRNDEMDGRSERQHVTAVSVLIRAKAGEWRQQPMMQIDDATSGESPTSRWRQNTHVTCEQNEIDLVLIEKFNHPRIVRISFRIANVVPIDTELLGNTAT